MSSVSAITTLFRRESSFSFTATGFGAGAPQDPVTGTVTFTFDNSAPFFNAADGAIVNGLEVDVNVFGLNLPGAWVPVLTYINNAMVPDVLAIGHSLNGTVVNAGTDDWRVGHKAEGRSQERAGAANDLHNL